MITTWGNLLKWKCVSKQSLFLFFSSLFLLVSLHALPFPVSLAQSPPYKQQIAILTYHHLLPESLNLSYKTDESVLSVEMFEKQMKYLHDNDFHVLSLDELQAFIKGQKKVPPRSVVITFDDGYKSNLIYAYPILQKYGYQATMFVITHMLPTSPQPFNANKLTMVSFAEMQQVRDVFSFQSHTDNMHKKKGAAPYLIAMPEQDVKNDLLRSKQMVHARFFAYPYGMYNSRVVRLLRETGYEMAFTTNRAYARQTLDVYRIPRFSIYRSTTMKAFMEIVTGQYK